ENKMVVRLKLGFRLLRCNLSYKTRLSKVSQPKETFRRAYCSSESPAKLDENKMNNNVSEYETFSWMKKIAPVFPVNGNKIKVLYQPAEFFTALKDNVSKAQHRIVIASLYLGSGHLEQELIDCIYKASQLSKENNGNLKVDILLDHTRGSRGKVNSRTMLLPLLQDFENVSVALYHTPDLRGWLRRVMPEKFNETIGLQHMKIYLFDDTLIISGANLSNDYFSNRQDRYVMLENCKDLSDFYSNLIQTTSTFSMQLQPDNSEKLSQDFPYHPYKDRDGGKKFKAEAKQRIDNLIHQYMQSEPPGVPSASGDMPQKHNTSPEVKNVLFETIRSYTTGVNPNTIPTDLNPSMQNIHANQQNDHIGNHVDPKDHKSCIQNKKTKEDTPDTWVFPLIQMGQLGVFMDNYVTEGLLVSAPDASNLHLTSGYFNLTDEYLNTILLNSKADYDILMAHPEANGFFTARGILGAIPPAYTRIAKLFNDRLIQHKQENRIKLCEYFRKDWTFHSKGLWYYLPGDKLPVLTLIGSPNFGYRSVYRDLESQLAIVTENQELRQQLHLEQQKLYSLSTPVNAETFRQPDRYVPMWIRLVIRVIKTFF
ncbi:unnamed protein product, partial [Owenia fusiformis]